MMSPFASLLSSATVRALGWTLVHSLWQGAALALLLFVVLMRMRGARKRYWLAFGGLVVQFAAALVTFLVVYRPNAPTSLPVGAGSSGAAATARNVVIVSAPPEPDTVERLTGWLEPYLPIVAAVWALGLLVCLLRLAGGFQFLYRLRRYSLPVQEPRWAERVAAYSQALRLTRPVRLLESALVHVPMTMGFLKPVILLPIGLVNHLAPAEVEAVLAHELAHIARRDWLFNLVQACLEALFYFHPAVWWIGSVIRRERENCCDDMAVALTGSALAYAKTLVRLQEQTRPAPALALGLGGNAAALLQRRRQKPRFGLLLGRVQRILNQTQPSATSPMEKTFATILLFALLSLWTLRSDTAPQLKAAVMQAAGQPLEWMGLRPSAGPSAQIATDTVPPAPSRKSRRSITQIDDDRRVELEIEDDRVTRLEIDGEEVPERDYGKYEELVEELRSKAYPVAPPIPSDLPMPADAPPGMMPFPTPPGAPHPPSPPAAPSRIITEKDGNGNTILRIDGPGNDTRLLIKDGEVWLNGRKLDVGESINVGNSWNFGSEDFAFTWPDSNSFNFNFDFDNFPPALDVADLERIHEEMRQSIEQHHHDWEDNDHLSKSDRKALKKEMKKVEKEMKEAHQEMQKSMKLSAEDRQRMEHEMAQAHREAQAEMRQAEKAMRHAQVEARAAQQEAMAAQREALVAQREAERENRAMQAIQKQLVADNLIKNSKNFSLDLSPTEMRLNGKKQPDEVHKRYLDLYKSATGRELRGNSRYNNRQED